MTTVKRPARLFSFSDFAKSQPRDPPPGDRLDAMFMELISAINSTQDALAEIRRADGALKNHSITEHQLAPNLREQIVGDIQAKVAPIALTVAGTAASARDSERNAQLFAKDAEAAVNVARQMVTGLDALRHLVEQRTKVNTAAADVADIHATDSENWANYSKANADNAIAAKDEALQWAEFLAGPVVNSAEAPAYIAGTPFPNGLYYQPVQGGLAGLWSAKWWALFAQNLVGTAGFYYLGAWDHPPLPGEQNPATGQVVPNPLAQGSLYYDSTTKTLYFWDGDSWETPTAPTATFRSQYVYQATAGQAVFSGPDLAGATPDVTDSPSDVFVNGVRLIPVSDYQIDAVANTLTLSDPVAVNSMVQWDLLLPSHKLAPGTVNAFKVNPLTPDGVTRDFTLSYIEPGTGDTIPTAVGDGAQLLVSLDGAIQETGLDFTATGASLHFAVAPPADAHLFIIWYQPGASAP